MSNRTSRFWIVGLSTICVVLAAALATCAFFLIDRSISLSYSKASLETTEVALERATNLLEHEWIGLPQDAVISRLESEVERSNGKAMLDVNLSEGFISLDNVVFKIRDGKLSGVE